MRTHYLFKAEGGAVKAEKGMLSEYTSGEVTIYSHGLSDAVIKEILHSYKSEGLIPYVDSLTISTFLCIISDTQKGTIIVINDKFGNNEIYYLKTKTGFYLSDSLSALFDSANITPEVDVVSAYELLSFFTILPPRTIYKEAQAVPVGSMLTHSSEETTCVRYWNLEKRLSDKATDYEAHVNAYRKIFHDTIKQSADGKVAVALSGGIDSGGILGVLTDIKKSPVPSISVGAQGPNSHDLVSARKTVAHFASPNVELYPEAKSFLSLLAFVAKNIQQPISVEMILSCSPVYKKAKEMGYEKLYFGYGTQLLLGNLKSAQFEYATRLYEKYLPRIILNPLYLLYAKYKGFSETRVAYLLASSWRERFGYAKGALYTREKHLFKALPQNFFDEVTAHIAPIEASSIARSDAFVIMEITSWIECQQQKDGHAIARVFEMESIAPWNTPTVAEIMFRTSDEMRRRNKWQKQLIRDMLKPFVPEHLYTRGGNSLLVPYTTLFEEYRPVLIAYLKGNKLIQKLIDMDRYEKDYNTLPEPGLSLLRLTSLALWYDGKHDKNHLEEFESQIK